MYSKAVDNADLYYSAAAAAADAAGADDEDDDDCRSSVLQPSGRPYGAIFVIFQ